MLHNHGFDGYPIWVANYNQIVEPETENWTIRQFSGKGSLPGIDEKIDLNVLVGGEERLEGLLIR